MSYWQRWVSHPQNVWLRKATFQLHLWSGIGIGLYVLVVSLTGSVVVYRNELYVAATRDPIVVTQSGPLLTDDELKAAATRLYPEYAVLRINRAQNPNQAVSIALNGSRGGRDRLFNPYTGEDLGNTAPLGIRIVSKLLELHDDLLAGNTGRSINGFGGLLLIILVFTGMVVWWPGIKAWRRSLVVHRNVGWRRFTWDLHSMIGFWTLGFIVLFGLSGVYLGNPELVQGLVDKIDPPTADNVGSRFSDQVIYWLAYLHFGRINGIVTGASMWWNRVLRKRFRRIKPEESTYR
jgi:uncharacterized iron-regulated membrane protein